MDFVELRTLGFNAQTAGFCGTLFFTMVSLRVRFLQYRTIMMRRSGESVATSASIFRFFFFAIILVYGIATDRLALICNGTMLLPSAAIVAGLWRFKRFVWIDWVTVTFGSVALGMSLLAEQLSTRTAVFGLVMVSGVVWGLAVPYELWRTKKQGSFRIEVPLVAAISTSFWVAYAFATRDRTLMVICPIELVCSIVTVALWLRCGGDLRTLFRRRA